MKNMDRDTIEAVFSLRNNTAFRRVLAYMQAELEAAALVLIEKDSPEDRGAAKWLHGFLGTVSATKPDPATGNLPGAIRPEAPSLPIGLQAQGATPVQRPQPGHNREPIGGASPQGGGR